MTLVALPALALARVRGPDAAAFLHAQLTADVAALGVGEASFACYCSPRGQVYGLLLVCRTGEEHLLVADAGLLPGMLQRLRMFVLRARVQLDLHPSFAVFGQTGDGLPDGPLHVFTPSGAPGSYCVAPADAGSPEGLDHWRAQELGHNVVWLSAPTSERFIPQMLGFENIGAVSFSKGCYPGQEVIARARYLGKVKRGPLRLRLPLALDVAAGESIRVLDGEQWLEAIAVDSVVERAGPGEFATTLFAVGPPATGAVESLEHLGRSYRCATM